MGKNNSVVTRSNKSTPLKRGLSTPSPQRRKKPRIGQNSPKSWPPRRQSTPKSAGHHKKKASTVPRRGAKSCPTPARKLNSSLNSTPKRKGGSSGARKLSFSPNSKGKKSTIKKKAASSKLKRSPRPGPARDLQMLSDLSSSISFSSKDDPSDRSFQPTVRTPIGASRSKQPRRKTRDKSKARTPTPGPARKRACPRAAPGRGSNSKAASRGRGRKASLGKGRTAAGKRANSRTKPRLAMTAVGGVVKPGKGRGKGAGVQVPGRAQNWVPYNGPDKPLAIWSPNGTGPKHVLIHVEACAKDTSQANVMESKAAVVAFIESLKTIPTDEDIKIEVFTDKFLQEHISFIAISEGDITIIGDSKATLGKYVDVARCTIKVNLYQLFADVPVREDLEDDDEPVQAATHWLLPSKEFHGLWESLIYKKGAKEKLLNYSTTTMLFSKRNVDSNIINWNRVVLLHGPPGTGKTSMCKALAQKICVRLSDKYCYGRFVEINSHGLFSKWFSESGKLVLRMFSKIYELVNDTKSLVCILIDEVESLASVRKANSQEPSDAIRTVNALLTQIDQLKRYPNVLIFTTSNVTGAIDLAFVDRADIKMFIGPPSVEAIYKIYLGCFHELMRTEIVSPKVDLLTWRELSGIKKSPPPSSDSAVAVSLQLQKLAKASASLSGRTLRKIPFLTHAMYLQKPTSSPMEFMEAMGHTIVLQFEQKQSLNEFAHGTS